MRSNEQRRILIAPLDWGLGHTTRCIPVIAELQRSGCVVLFAGNEWQCAFIEESLPGIETCSLDGYEIRYGNSAFLTAFALILQIPGILRTIKREHAWLTALVRKKHIDGIISDNRYGLHHPEIQSVIMTHQLQIRSGWGGLTDTVLRKLHYRLLRRFQSCWVVDLPQAPGLAGTLSHPEDRPGNEVYIGTLSRFGVSQKVAVGSEIVILLSGPEPQRTMLSDLLWEQVKHYHGNVIFIEGRYDAPDRESSLPNLRHMKIVSGRELEPILQQAALVISRSGYSTVMDLVAMRKRAILLPTPGQTEQEYLGRYLMDRKIFYSASQNEFILSKALISAELFYASASGFNIPGPGVLREIIEDWTSKL
ncbi:MAG: glycosyl transferase family 28 [Sphingobacteriales bacterium]|nr:MAG: glycosyl transferase family 28 [Sphingobacteriales bacterium]